MKSHLGLLRSLIYKDKLYVKLKSTPINHALYEMFSVNFKTYTKILRQMINSAKKMYYQNCFDKFKFDLKKTWSTINGMLNRNENRKDFPKYFEIYGLPASNEKRIANEFNKYFVNVGQDLTQNTLLPSEISFQDYLTTPISHNFEFTTVTTEAIAEVINSLKPKQ